MGIITGVIIQLTTGLISQQFNNLFDFDRASQKNEVTIVNSALDTTKTSATTETESEVVSKNEFRTKTGNSENITIDKEKTFMDEESGIIIALYECYEQSAKINMTFPEENSNLKIVNLGDVITTKFKGFLYKIIIKEIYSSRLNDKDDYIKIMLTKEIMKNTTSTQSKSSINDIVGIYEGSCSGLYETSGIKLNIYLTNKDTAEAKVTFVRINNIPPAECLMKVEYNKDNKTLVMTGYEWINRNDYLPDLRINFDGETLIGDILNGNNFPSQDIGKKAGDFIIKKK